MKKMTSKLKKPAPKKKKWLIPAIIVGALAAAIYFGATALRESNIAGPSMQIRTASAERGDIEVFVAGSGNLKSGDSIGISVPSILPVKDIQVEQGDTVKAGDVLATIDGDVLQDYILQIQDEIALVDEEINEAKSGAVESKITAPVAGRVKDVAVSEGDSISGIMVQKGYLILLSLDGKMKADIQSGENPEVGSGVIAVLPDGSELKGNVVSSGPSAFTVTLTDDGPAPGQTVSIRDKDGVQLGSGDLEINEPLNIVAGRGTVKSVNVKLNDRVGREQSLITLLDTEYELKYLDLIRKRVSYENLFRLLLKYSETNTVVADMDGSITEIQTGQQSASQGGIPQIDIGSILENLPISAVGGDDAMAWTLEYAPEGNGFPGQPRPQPGQPRPQSGQTRQTRPQSQQKDMRGNEVVFAADMTIMPAGGEDLAARTLEYTPVILDSITPEGYTAALKNAPPLVGPSSEILGLSILITPPALGGVPQTTIPPETEYTGMIVWEPPGALFAPQTVYTAVVTLQAEPGYSFDSTLLVDVPGAVVSTLSFGPATPYDEVEIRAVFPATGALPPGIDLEKYLEDLLRNSLQGATSGLDLSGLGLDGLDLGGLGDLGGTFYIDGSSLFSGGSSGSGVNTAMATLCTITPGREFFLTVDVDESDIFSIKEGQPVKIMVSAMLDDVFSGRVEKVSTVGVSQSGIASYPVTILLDQTDTPLLAGMNASAEIIFEIKENVLMIPLDALQEQGDEKFVYIYDPSKPAKQKDGQALGEIRIVTTGISDGLYVEITSGLEEGEEVIYMVAETDAFRDAFIAIGGDRGRSDRSDT